MASKNEAKIRFTAETQEFQSSLKDAKNEIKNLNSELKLNAAEMRNTGESAELLQKRHELLTQKLEANAQEQEALTGKLEAATEIYGADSEEVAKLERQLTGAMTAQQNIEAELSNVNERVEEQQSALGQLTSTIQDQEAELQNLQTEYVNTALEFGTESDEAETLADRIRTLSSDLEENKIRLNDATGAAHELTGGMSGAGAEIENTDSALDKMSELAGDAGGQVMGMISNIAGAIAAGGVAGGIMAIASALVEVGKEAVDMAIDFQEASATIVEGTGLIGDDLKDLEDRANAAWAAIANADMEQGDYASAAAELSTRLQLSGDAAQAATEDFARFSAITGENATKSVDMFADAMARWGLEVEDIPTLMDQVTVANQSCDAGVSSLMSNLTTYATTWKDLGYSTEEALGQMVAWEQAGLNSDQVIRGLDKACRSLADSNEKDIPGAIQTALAAVSEADDRYAGLNVKIGDTGKTIADVFGSRMSGAIVDAMQSNAVATDQWTEAVKNSDQAMMITFQNSRTAKDEFNRQMTEMKQAVKNIFDTRAEGIRLAGEAMAEANGLDLEAIRGTNDYTSSLEKLGEQSKTTSSDIKTSMGDANKSVSAGITEMQTTMGNMQWKVPKPLIPTFGISGEFNLETKTVPSIEVVGWHGKGGIFSQPTLLTSRNGLLHGVGEAGPEAIAPIETLQHYVIDAVSGMVPEFDYDRMAAAVAKLDIAMDIDGREFGRIVRNAI